MPLLNFANRRSATAGNAGSIGNLAFRIGNAIFGQGVFLTGTTQPIAVEAENITWSAFETITVSSTAVALTEARAVGHTHALITVETAAVRFRIDNIAPTASVGHTLDVGDVLKLENNQVLDQIQFIRRDGADATIQVSYGLRRYE